MPRSSRRPAPAILIILTMLPFFGAVLGAQEAEDETAAGVRPEEASIRFVLDPDLRIFGLDLSVGLGGPLLLPPADTRLLAELGGAYGQASYFRLPDGSIFDEAVGPNTGAQAPYYDRISLTWGIGIEQGILWDPFRETNMIEVSFHYRGLWEDNLPAGDGPRLIYAGTPAGAAPGAEEILINSLLLITSFDGVTENPVTKVRDGGSAEASLEWAPAFLLNSLIGRSDYARLNLSLETYVPFVGVASEEGMNLFSLYGAARAAADLLVGHPEDVPYLARSRVGGSAPRAGLGGAVRGYDPGRFDSRLKVLVNMELRAHLPALFVRDLVPGLVAFVDSGFWSGLFDAPASHPDEGWLFGAGFGLSLNLFDLARVLAYLQVNLGGENVNGSSVIFPALAFSYHF